MTKENDIGLRLYAGQVGDRINQATDRRRNLRTGTHIREDLSGWTT